MAGAGSRRARRALSGLPSGVAVPLRRLGRRVRATDRRRVVTGMLDRAGTLGRSVPVVGVAVDRVAGARTLVTATGWSTVMVTGADGSRERSLLPADAGPPETVADALVVRVPDPAALVRLAAAGLLSGTVRSLRVRLDAVSTWVREGVRPGSPDPSATRPAGLSWRAAGAGVDVAAEWARPAGVAAALDTALRCVVRTGPWPQAGGPLPVTDRAGWLAGASTPPQGVLLDTRPVPHSTGPGPLRPFADPAPWDGPHPVWSPVGAAASPARRKLLGEPARYALRADRPGRLAVTGPDGAAVAVFDGSVSPEAVLATPELARWATVTLPAGLTGPAGSADPQGAGGWTRLVLATLATGGLVPVPVDAPGRDLLSGLGIPCPGTAGEVTGVEGYAWSAAVARAAGVLTDPALRRTALAAAAGGPPARGALLPLPSVGVVVSSMRPDTVGALLTDLAAQTHPSFEVVLGTHGWTAAPEQVAHWGDLLGRPLRVSAHDRATPFGEVLAALSRTSDADLLTKADDDDVYGPDHLLDLVLDHHQTGADLVAKAPRFVHLEDPGTPAGADPRAGTTGTTVDRTWAASETFGRTPAGGTLLLARSTLLAAGGWSGSVRHVDIDLGDRVRQAGGITHRTHGLGYVYVRHAHGHTWEVDHSLFLEQAGDVLPGLPAALATGRPAALRTPRRASPPPSAGAAS